MKWEEKFNNLPDHPGVYIFKDESGRFLYVGKASSLRKRVKSYLSSTSPKIKNLLAKAKELDFILTSNPVEALLLEFNFIKQYRPRYNIMLRDDKKYPYIKVTIHEPFPSIYLTRDLRDKEAKYFGPYTNAKAARTTLRLLRKIFPFKTCRKTKIDGKPCLNFYLGRCPGPCRGEVERQEYMKNIERAISFLEGKTKSLIKLLQEEMEKKAENLEFEEAARIRDQIRAMEKLVFKQGITTVEEKDRDILGLALHKNRGMVSILKIREGRLIGEENLPLKGVNGWMSEEIISSFILQYYSQTSSIPEEIIIPIDLPEKDTLQKYLKEKHGKKVKFHTANTKELEDLLKIATTNAQFKLLEEETGKVKEIDPLLYLQRDLNLPQVPYIIEGYDISQLKGGEAVGSKVVFEKGVPRKDAYRRYKIKEVRGVDDYGMMKEVIKRRIRRLKEGEIPPDLILVDGGRGQLNVVKETLWEEGLNIPVVGLAKGEEKIYLSWRRYPLLLPRSSPTLKLLMRIRDEAHRFAHSYHLHLRKKRTTHSLWDELPGVGEKLKKELQKHFPTIEALKSATEEDLIKVKGIGIKKAKNILETLRGK